MSGSEVHRFRLDQFPTTPRHFVIVGAGITQPEIESAVPPAGMEPIHILDQATVPSSQPLGQEQRREIGAAATEQCRSLPPITTGEPGRHHHRHPRQGAPERAHVQSKRLGVETGAPAA